MGGGAVTARPVASESAAAIEAQLADVRDVLRRDAEAAGVDPAAVDAAAAARYADATVHGFAGILVERAVRTALALPRTP